MSSRGVLAGAVGVGEEGAVDGFGELSFEESEGFVAAVAGVASALVVVAAGAWADGLGGAARWMAWLSWRLPCRDSRWRTTSPLLASMGAVPA